MADKTKIGRIGNFPALSEVEGVAHAVLSSIQNLVSRMQNKPNFNLNLSFPRRRKSTDEIRFTGYEKMQNEANASPRATSPERRIIRNEPNSRKTHDALRKTRQNEPNLRNTQNARRTTRKNEPNFHSCSPQYRNCLCQSRRNDILSPTIQERGHLANRSPLDK